MDITKKLAMNSRLLLVLFLSVIILVTDREVQALGAPDLTVKALQIGPSGNIVVTAVETPRGHKPGPLEEEEGKKGCLMPCPNNLIPEGICTRFDDGEYTDYEDLGCCLSCCVPDYC